MIGDITALTNPPAAIQFMCKLLLILFDIKYSAKDDGKKIFTSCSAKLLKGKFLEKLKAFDGENIPEEKKVKVRKEIELREAEVGYAFEQDIYAKKGSQAAGFLTLWVNKILEFNDIFLFVAPL